MDERKKLGMESADPQNLSEWRGPLRGRLVRQAKPFVEETRLQNGKVDDEQSGNFMYDPNDLPWKSFSIDLCNSSVKLSICFFSLLSFAVKRRSSQ